MHYTSGHTHERTHARTDTDTNISVNSTPPNKVLINLRAISAAPALIITIVASVWLPERVVERRLQEHSISDNAPDQSRLVCHLYHASGKSAGRLSSPHVPCDVVPGSGTTSSIGQLGSAWAHYDGPSAHKQSGDLHNHESQGCKTTSSSATLTVHDLSRYAV